MRVLMQNRFDAFSVYGGDTAQMLKTKEYLTRLGADVSVSLEPAPDLSGYDIVHLFNITRIHETYAQFKNAKRQKRKIALSTIYLDFSEYDRKGRHGKGRVLAGSIGKDYFEAVKYLPSARDLNSCRALLTMLRVGYGSQQKEVLEGSDILLPNSEMELIKVTEDFAVNKRYVAVPNGIERSVYSDRYFFREKEKAVLCVGRIEPRKNQLSLVRALKGTGIKLYLAGGIYKRQRRYCAEVLGELDAMGGEYLGFMQGDSEELKEAYARAKVHCLPSWFETTGLVNLEAALYGCSVVSTDRGYSSEYLGDGARYCSPDDQASIREAVFHAMNAPLNTGLRDRVLNNFTWENAALKTMEAYRQIL